VSASKEIEKSFEEKNHRKYGNTVNQYFNIFPLKI